MLPSVDPGAQDAAHGARISYPSIEPPANVRNGAAAAAPNNAAGPIPNVAVQPQMFQLTPQQERQRDALSQYAEWFLATQAVLCVPLLVFSGVVLNKLSGEYLCVENKTSYDKTAEGLNECQTECYGSSSSISRTSIGSCDDFDVSWEYDMLIIWCIAAIAGAVVGWFAIRNKNLSWTMVVMVAMGIGDVFALLGALNLLYEGIKLMWHDSGSFIVLTSGLLCVQVAVVATALYYLFYARRFYPHPQPMIVQPMARGYPGAVPFNGQPQVVFVSMPVQGQPMYAQPPPRGMLYGQQPMRAQQPVYSLPGGEAVTGQQQQPGTLVQMPRGPGGNPNPQMQAAGSNPNPSIAREAEPGAR